MKKLPILLFLLSSTLATFSKNETQKDVVLKTLENEAHRNLDVLKTQTVPAYFIAYRVTDLETLAFSASFGCLSGKRTPRHSRYLHVQTRVGDYASDNSHELKNATYSNGTEAKMIGLEDNATSLVDVLWMKTDASYKEAVQRYEQIKANTAVSTASEDVSPDFSKQKTDFYYETPVHLSDYRINTRKWEETLTRLSQSMSGNKDILKGLVSFTGEVQRRWFYNTEGTAFAENCVYFRVTVSMSTVAEDGMELPLYKSFLAAKPEELPSEAALENEIDQMSLLLSELRKAPLAEPYSGPCILSADAVGVFFHEFFGHRIEGARMKQENDAQTFKKKIGEKVLSDDLSVTFDPSVRTFQKNHLNGSYTMDDEGVRGQKVEVVKNGVLKSFLMSRTPIDGFPESNGHGRAAYYLAPVTRQSNMFVTCKNSLPNDTLVARLRTELRKSGKEYGYFFSSVSGGFTNTTRISPNAFNVMPLVVYRVYADNRPQELVRGVNIIGTPLSVFSQILACGDEYRIFNGYCGAESGSIPVSCIAPALLIGQIETQKKQKSRDLPPILERP